MVHRMDACHGVKEKVKDERDDEVVAVATRDILGPSEKRPRLSCDGFPESKFERSMAECNPLNEPSPLGLRLRKSPSLLELIQMKLSQEHKKTKKSPLASNSQNANFTDKLKASNFPASLLRIGTWEYMSEHEGDLVGKCYFAKHKLVWEVLDGSLKNKIESQWSDIVGIKANYAISNASDTLEVVLARQPLFFRETNPQPRKHTLWQPTSDFTNGQATIHRRHLLHCPQGILERHLEKLIQCDFRLNVLSQQPDVFLKSPYFDQKMSIHHEHEPNHGFDLGDERSFFAIPGTSHNGTQSSSSMNESQELPSIGPDNHSSTPSSGMDIGAIEKFVVNSPEQNLFNQWSHAKVPGIHPSMSMSDLVTHLGHCISEEKGFGDSFYPANEQLNRDVLDELSRYLLNDSTIPCISDEQSLVSRVNSLCNLLQKDAEANHDPYAPNDGGDLPKMWKSEAETGPSDSMGEFNAGSARFMIRNDSVEELLHNLPRIAPFPHILPVVPEESGSRR